MAASANLWNKRIAVIAMLAFSSGLPLALVGSTLQLMYTAYGFSLLAIGSITLLSLPYTLKFLWAPLMDRFSPSFLGRRRGWVLIAQLVIAVGLLLMGLLNPLHHSQLLFMLAVLVAFGSASQDISFDAYRTDILHADERGLGASVNTIGYRLAMLVSGAFAVALAVKTSWQFSYSLMALLMLLLIAATVWAPSPVKAKPPANLSRAILDPLSDILKRRKAIWIIIFILTYKLCDAFALSLSSVFLVRGVGFSLTTIAGTTKVVGLVASLMGAMAGGLIYKRLGLWRSLFCFGVLQTLSNFTYLYLALSSKIYIVMATAVFTEFFCSGVSAVAFVAFLMALCNHRYTAMQYAIFSALAALAHTVVGPFAGLVARDWGWVNFYILSIVLGLPSLLILIWLRSRIDFSRLTSQRVNDINLPDK